MPSTMTNAELRERRNVDEFITEFNVQSDSAVGVIVVRTREPTRLQHVLQDIAIANEMAFAVWDITAGRREYPRPDPSIPDQDVRTPTSTDGAQVDVTKFLGPLADKKQKAEGIFVMLHPQSFFDRAPFQQYIRNFAEKALEWQGRLVLIVPESVSVPVEMEDDVYVMDFRPPSHAELVAVWRDFMDRAEDNLRPAAFDDSDVDLIVQNAVGMTTNEFEKSLSIATIEMLVNGDDDAASTITPQDYISYVLKQKVEVIKKTDILELIASGSMDDIGGLDRLKAWMQKRAKAYSDEAREFGLEIPKGVLCVGPPGAGKSLFAKATASVFGVPLVKFDIGRVFNKFVGDSESRMRSALKLVEAMSPCILFIDEVDKGFGGMGGSGDSGTSQRVFGTFLTWMQERNSADHPVFVVMTANNVLDLPAELMRKGRVDEIFAVTFPSEMERAEILRIHLTKRGHTLSDEGIAKIVKVTDKFVGAELEGVVIEGLMEAFDKGFKKPTAEVFVSQAREITPLSKSMAKKVEAMNEWARNNAKPASTGMDFAPAAGTVAGPGKRNLSIRRVMAPKGGAALDG